MGDGAAVRELVSKMAEEREKLLGQLEALSEEAAARMPADGVGEAQWSAKEQAVHLAEMETTYYAWIERALAEENPDLTHVRGKSVAIPLEDANDHTVAELVRQLRDLRAETLRLIHRLTPGDLERTATQPMFGRLTVLQWLRSYYRHDRMHQAQIAGRAPEYQPRYASGGEPDQRRRRSA